MTNHEMDRLNEVIEQLADLIKDRKSFIDGDAEHDDVFMADIQALEDAIIGIKELQDLKRKQDSGLLVELPCKVGDTVYVIDGFDCGVCCIRHDRILSKLFEYSDIGKTVFLTKEDAEKALKELEG